MPRQFNPDKYTEGKKEALLKAYDKLIRVESQALRYAPIDVDWKSVNFELRPVSGAFIDIHHYFYQVVSSFPNKESDCAGARWLFNLWETNSDRIVGVLRISSDFLKLGPRDKYLGIDGLAKGKQFTFQLKGVIPMPPFNRLAGGKLLTALAFSNDVQNLMRQTQTVAGISVCSIYGESIVYDRIPYIKFLGETVKGTGVYFGATASNSIEYINGKAVNLQFIDRPKEEIIKWWSPLFDRRLIKECLHTTEDEFMVSKKVQPLLTTQRLC